MSQRNKSAERHPCEAVYTERSERALSPLEEPALRETKGSGAEVEPPCGRERSKSRRACPERSRRTKSRAQPREPNGPVPFTSADRTECVHPPLLLANRGSAELEMVPSPCKQRATLLSNRGKIRMVQPFRHRSRTTHPSSLPFLIATRAYSREELTRWKQRPATPSNRHKIHSCTERSERVAFAPAHGRNRRASERAAASYSGIGRDTAAREGFTP